MFDFEKLDQTDLRDGPTPISSEGERSLLDHRWVWMGLFVFGLGVVLQNPALVALTGFMLAAVAFCWLWSRAVLGEMRYQRRFHHRRAFPGEDVEASITVENNKLLPVTWLQIEDEWPTAFGPADEGLLTPSATTQMSYLVNVYSLGWFERVRRKYLLTARARGVYPIGPAHMITGDPFSLFEKGIKKGRPDVLIVYPRVKPLDSFGLFAKDPFGELRSPQRIFEDPLRTIGVRDYHSGDTLRSVHWKATARAGSLQVRQYEPTRSMSLVLCLNIASFEEYWRGVWPELIEHLIEVAASITGWGLESGHAVGIAANATLAQGDRALLSQPNRGRDQLMYLLEMLAGISYFISREFSQFLLSESTRLPWGATLVIVTGFMNEAIEGALLQLRANGRRVVLVMVGREPPPDLYNILTVHLPLSEASLKPIPIPHLTHANTPESETPRQRFLRERAARDAEPRSVF